MLRPAKSRCSPGIEVGAGLGYGGGGGGVSMLSWQRRELQEGLGLLEEGKVLFLGGEARVQCLQFIQTPTRCERCGRSLRAGQGRAGEEG